MPPPVARPPAPAAPDLTAEVVVGDSEQVLQAMVAELLPAEHERKPDRPRILPALALWSGRLVGVRRGFTHQTVRWRRLSQHGLWTYPRFPVSDQAVATRLATAGTAPRERLSAHVTTVLAARLAPVAATDLAPFAAAGVVLDETTRDPVARTLPALRGSAPGDGRRLPGQLAGGDPFDVSLALLVEEVPRYAQAGRDPVAAFVDHGRAAGDMRPSRRTVIPAPHIPRHHLIPLPPDLVLVQPPLRRPQRRPPLSRTPRSRLYSSLVGADGFIAPARAGIA